MNHLKSFREENNCSRKEISVILNKNIKYVVDVEKGVETLSNTDKAALEKHFNLPENYFGPMVSTSIGEPNDFLIDDYEKIIAKNVKYYREKHNMTQQIFAEEVGFTMASSVSAIERGIKPIGKKKLIQIAKLFNVHVSELFSPFDLSDTDSDAKLLHDFEILVRSKPRPSIVESIKALVATGHEELRRL